jgi:ubiquinone/menaquinone biosynthesis C-methylase UbiE
MLIRVRLGKKPDPSEYSTVADPMEVPCQKEAYFYALNSCLRDGDDVLDVGCGIGYGMNILSIKGGAVVGVDVDERAVEYCQKHVYGKNPRISGIHHYEGYNLPFDDKSFDVVTCVDVLEHVENYHLFLDELLRVAKRVVFFSTPNRRLEYTNRDGSPKNYWHLREWSQGELEKILEQHAASVRWQFIDGAWDGPFEVVETVSPDTLVLMPTLWL